MALRLRERLSSEGLQMFYRLLVWQQDVNEVCQATGRSADAVYQWRSRIRRTIQNVLDELGLERAGVDGQPSPEGVR